jgi:MOSC domain-containing protein YiiM
MRVTLAGCDGDHHAGLTRVSGGRSSRYPRGTEIRNSRQVSILSAEELAEVAAAMGLPEIQPEWLGANLMVEGIPALTLLPPATRLYFPQDTALVVLGENHPCTTAGGAIQAQYPGMAGLAQQFPSAALHRRGIVAWVERAGIIAAGDTVQVEFPDQPLYPY